MCDLQFWEFAQSLSAFAYNSSPRRLSIAFGYRITREDQDFQYFV